MVIKYTGGFVLGTILTQVLAPSCPEHDIVCNTLGEPWHTHNEIPSDGDSIIGGNSMAASGVNVSVGVSSISLAGDIKGVLIKNGIRSDEYQPNYLVRYNRQTG